MRYLYLLIIFLTLIGTGFAQSPSSVLKRAEKALGGGKALSSFSTSVRTGTIKRLSDGIDGRYLEQAARPNLLNISYELGGYEYESGYNGRSAWTRNSRDGLQTLTGKGSIDMAVRAVFASTLWLRAKDQKWRITTTSQTEVGEAAVVIATPKGSTIKLYFDVPSGLPVREELPNSDGVEIREFSDYRDIGGTKQPYFIRLKTGGEVYEIRLDDIKINTPISSSEFSFPAASGQALPDIPALLREVQSNEDRVEAILDNYSFTQKFITRELGKDGVLRETESETYQLSFLKGHRIKRLIEKNGKPLSEKDQAEADKDAAEEAEKLEKKAAKEEERIGKQSSKGAPSEDNRRVSIAEVLRASRLINPRRERFRGRGCVVFDFEPDPAFDMKNAKSMLKFFGKTAGVMWIDEKDKQVARIEAVLFESFKMGGGVLAKLQKGASFMLEQERVGDEIWLPSVAEINLSVRVLLVKGITLNQVVRSYGYSKFQTEVKDSKVNEPSKPN